MPDETVSGRSPETLTLKERFRLIGKWIALEIYTPETFPFRRIEAVGDSTEECIEALRGRGLDPRNFEFTQMAPPF